MSLTANFAMPLLHAAQAQKEITHNEALVLIDALLSGVALATIDDPAALSPEPGQMWIVGMAPVGPWAGQAARIAVYSEGGWRFAPAVEGMCLFDRSAAVMRRYKEGAWTGFPAIAEAAGGSTVDMEARAVLAEVLATLRQAGLVAVT